MILKITLVGSVQMDAVLTNLQLKMLVTMTATCLERITSSLLSHFSLFGDRLKFLSMIGKGPRLNLTFRMLLYGFLC